MTGRLAGSKTAGLLTLVATYVLVVLDIHLTGADYAQTLTPALLAALLVPGIGAAYGVFFFHWMFESGRAAPYPDYGVFIWLVSAVVSLFYSAILFGLVYAITDSVVDVLASSLGPEQSQNRLVLTALHVLLPFWTGQKALVEFFEPITGLNIALWFPLCMLCCWAGKRTGLRAAAARPAAG
ncbi:hypothetical protein [Labrys monachus]|uniref:Uncharacterized protein n=1 Tax=Labrys monachus TaxID=217067 RepID=A0ABU0FF19_9HYPH|nr:hypothetical protein [Labrys monachus]MDQ0393205.1 hypothetical protein [Labrys monachus]